MKSKWLIFIFQEILSSLHDICQYLCAHARLGSSHARLGSQKLEFSGVTADWGGTEGIGMVMFMSIIYEVQEKLPTFQHLLNYYFYLEAQ